MSLQDKTKSDTARNSRRKRQQIYEVKVITLTRGGLAGA